MKIDPQTAQLLEREAARIHCPEFVTADPVQFPRRFDRKDDIEIVSLLGSHLAWGNRKMICRDIERLLDRMEGEPARWVREGEFESVSDEENIHRTFFGRNLKHFCRGLQKILAENQTIDDFCRRCGAPQSAAPAWTLAAAMNQQMAEANGGRADSRCLPLALDSSALKRLNMALRWLVRQDDGIVDLGVWDSLTPAQLFIPLDVHVGNTSRALGLTSRKANDRRTTEEITAALRSLRPDDPTFYDFALFGIGVS
ncbi:MAG: TIGR02757 family protein [Muribaculaceae bacterium]|nr:TIGR02757 family protein [Muribaculaceae bacterium]